MTHTLGTRVIPCLLLNGESLVKTVKFRNASYIGDPVNTVRIFNELEVDELILLDINAARTRSRPNFKLIADIAQECFMPLAYGGGVASIEDMKTLFGIGIEKIALNTAAFDKPDFIRNAANIFGEQSIVGSIDVKKGLLGKREVYVRGGSVNTRRAPADACRELQALGVGEILITSIDREGTWSGFDLDLVRAVSKEVSVPVIANGGAGAVEHIGAVVREAGASAVALGSMVVYQSKGLGVLVNFPDRQKLALALA